MLAAYVTTDDVNSALAQQFAEECQTQIHDLRPGEMPSDLAFDAVVYDLDYLPAEHRARSSPNCWPRLRHGPSLYTATLWTIGKRPGSPGTEWWLLAGSRRKSSSGSARRLQMRG